MTDFGTAVRTSVESWQRAFIVPDPPCFSWQTGTLSRRLWPRSVSSLLSPCWDAGRIAPLPAAACTELCCGAALCSRTAPGHGADQMQEDPVITGAGHHVQIPGSQPSQPRLPRQCEPQASGCEPTFWEDYLGIEAARRARTYFVFNMWLPRYAYSGAVGAHLNQNCGGQHVLCCSHIRGKPCIDAHCLHMGCKQDCGWDNQCYF